MTNPGYASDSFHQFTMVILFCLARCLPNVCFEHVCYNHGHPVRADTQYEHSYWVSMVTASSGERVCHNARKASYKSFITHRASQWFYHVCGCIITVNVLIWRSKKVCYKVSLCKNCRRQRCKAFINWLNYPHKNDWWARPILPKDLGQTDRVIGASQR